MQADASIKPRHFALPDSNQRLVLTPRALQVFIRYRQAKDEPEAGGLLFAEFNFPLIQIVEVTSHIFPINGGEPCSFQIAHCNGNVSSKFSRRVSILSANGTLIPS
jgi:hypothetical protein